MAVKRKTRRKKRRSKKNKKSKSILWRIILPLGIFAALVLVVYSIYLDQRIRTEFESNRWRVPARVYAQPIELYLGQDISLQRVKQELSALGYVQSEFMNHPARFQVINSSTLDISTRDFTFWDQKLERKLLRLRFGAAGITSIIQKNTAESIAIVRLEPRLIGKIYPEHNEDRVLIQANELSQELIDTVIAVEDRRFYEHFGIDPIGIARAFATNLWNLAYVQGGSTLTQQLVKNYFLSHDRTLRRKFNEVIMALLLEYHYSKDEILLAYMNEVYLGQNKAQAIHGFGTAAEYYFSKPINELNHAELALLAGMVKGASYYNPRKHPKRALKRRNVVLQLMFDQGRLSEAEYLAAKKKWLGVSKTPDWSGREYSAFFDLLRQQLSEYYDSAQLQNEGLQIFTTLVPHYQQYAQQAVRDQVGKFEQQYAELPSNTLEAGLILVATDTAEVLAVVGGTDADKRGFNHAITAERPVGSLIKPAVYLTALQSAKALHPLSLVDDSTVSIKNKSNGEIWQPSNYDKKIYGKQPMHFALAKSLNLATVNLGMELGLDRVIQTIKRLGVQKSIKPYPSILLGAAEFTVLEMTQMYQTLASGGFYSPLNAIHAVMNNQGELLQKKPIKVSAAVDSKATFVLQGMLANVVEQGTAKTLRWRFPQQRPLAGKTGTTDEKRDSWFAGYGGNFLSVVWLGRDDNQPTPLTGSTGALQVWADLMTRLPLQSLPMTAPEGVVWHSVPSVEDGCNGAFRLPFLATKQPPATELCD